MRATYLCALLLLAPMAASAQAYKCKLPNGKTSFQDQPCDEGSKSEPLIVSDPSPPSGDAPAPKKGQPPATSSKRDRSVPPGTQPKNTGDEALKERNRQLEADNRAMACSQARRNLSVLQNQRPVYSVDKSGNKVFVEDANRASALADAQQRVSDACR